MPVARSAHQVLKAAPHHPFCELAGEAVVLNVTSGTYFGLDAVGTRVWELLQEPRTLAELRDAVVEEFDVDPERCELDLATFLHDLRTRGLLEELGDTDR